MKEGAEEKKSSAPIIYLINYQTVVAPPRVEVFLANGL